MFRYAHPKCGLIVSYVFFNRKANVETSAKPKGQLYIPIIFQNLSEYFNSALSRSMKRKCSIVSKITFFNSPTRITTSYNNNYCYLIQSLHF